MIKITVDTNIIFSALLNTNSRIAQILINDTAFVAVSDYTKEPLWTGDLKLLNGLIKKGYKNIIKTNNLYQLSLSKENLK